MRKPLIAGNWKMYKTVGESVATALALKPLVANANHCEIVIAPVFTALKSVADRLEGSNIKVAAQNCAAEQKEGAFTGEVAAFMLRDAGCSHVIVGHSERRQYYSDSDEVVSRKIHAGLAAGLAVIVCVGETPEQAQEMHAFIRRVFAEGHTPAAASALRILYGGSVKPDNIGGLMKQADID